MDVCGKFGQMGIQTNGNIQHLSGLGFEKAGSSHFTACDK